VNVDEVITKVVKVTKGEKETAIEVANDNQIKEAAGNSEAAEK
jgi:hypothetical protein